MISNRKIFRTRPAPSVVRPLLLIAVVVFLSAFAPPADARQRGKVDAGKVPPAPISSPAQAPLLKRTTTRQETRRLGYGSSITLYGAPEGSIIIEAWPKSEVEITADVELRADTEEELARLATVNGFLLDDDVNHVSIITTGTHDRKFMKKAGRDFPKKLLTMPWRIDYRLRVPASSDLEIYAGRGALTLSGVEGALRLNAGETVPASFNFTGGDAEATIQRGAVNLRLNARSWRGRGARFRLGSGDLTVELPANFSGDVDAEILRTGRIENSYTGLTPREHTQATERSLQGRAGTGGAMLSFTVGDGTLRIVQESNKRGNDE